jgi:Putative Flp pilus-assembly TadE/G-like
MSERGSVFVSVAFLTAVAGLSAAALDVSSWYRTNRKLQSSTDGAALTGAQALPESPNAARTLVGDGTVTFSTTVVPNDTITVRRTHSTPGFFAGMLSGARQIVAEATARVGSPLKVRWAAPIGVDARHSKLSGPGCPCWNESTTLDSGKAGAGAFRLIDLGRSRRGAAATAHGDWIKSGFEGHMTLGWYPSDPAATIASRPVRSALQERSGSDLLFPIYRQAREGGTAAQYRVVGWAGFHLTGFEIKGSDSTLSGWFERVIWDGIQSELRSEHDFGVRTIALVD